MCRGNFRSSWAASGSYDFVAEALFSELAVDGFFLEYDDERSGSFAPLRFVPPGKMVVLGLVTTKRGELESKDALKRRIDEAAQYVPLDQLCLSPQCGFSSTVEGNVLSYDEQVAKLRLIVGDRGRGLGRVNTDRARRPVVAARPRPGRGEPAAVIASVPPLVDLLVAEFGLNAAQVGALTTLPVVCMGLFAPVAAAGGPPLRRAGGAGRGGRRSSVSVRRCGRSPVRPGSTVERSWPGRGSRWPARCCRPWSAGASPTGWARSLGCTPPPDQRGVPRRRADRAGAGRAGLTPQVVLALWSVPAALALVVWLLTNRGTDDAGRNNGEARVLFPWRDGRAWLGTAFMGGQSLLFYATLAWLAARYTSLGLSVRSAGLLLAVFSLAQIVTALALPALAHRTGSVRPWIAASMGLTTLGLGLVATVPLGLIGSAAPWTWAILLGLGMGGNLALALLVLTESAPTPQAASANTGMAFFVGYLVAAAGPVAAGALRDATGTFTPVFTVLTVLGVLTLIVGIASAPHAHNAPHRAARTQFSGPHDRAEAPRTESSGEPAAGGTSAATPERVRVA